MTHLLLKLLLVANGVKVNIMVPALYNEIAFLENKSTLFP